MKKRNEVESRAIRKRIAKQFAKQTARVVKRRASQAGCADWKARVSSHGDGRGHRQHAQFALQTAEHLEGARPPARPGVSLLSATTVACS